jgi:hypothetical protein
MLRAGAGRAYTRQGAKQAAAEQFLGHEQPDGGKSALQVLNELAASEGKTVDWHVTAGGTQHAPVFTACVTLESDVPPEPTTTMPSVEESAVVDILTRSGPMERLRIQCALQGLGHPGQVNKSSVNRLLYSMLQQGIVQQERQEGKQTPLWSLACTNASSARD